MSGPINPKQTLRETIFDLVHGMTIEWVDEKSKDEDRELCRKMLDFLKDTHSRAGKGKTVLAGRLEQMSPEDRQRYDKLDKRLRMIDERDCGMKIAATVDGYDLCHKKVDPSGGADSASKNICILKRNHPKEIPHIAESGYQRLESEPEPIPSFD